MIKRFALKYNDKYYKPCFGPLDNKFTDIERCKLFSTREECENLIGYLCIAKEADPEDFKIVTMELIEIGE